MNLNPNPTPQPQPSAARFRFLKRQVSIVATPTASMIGVALPTLKISQYPAAVQTNSRTKKTMRLMAESLEIFNQYSRRVNKHCDRASSYISISQIYVDSFMDVIEKQKVTSSLK